MRPALLIAALAFTAALPGCVIVQTGVTNPIPGMTTVAVAPFVNLSAERVVDGRRFALAYHAELQKIPGYQVIPVGVTEQAMVDLEIDLDSPDDALKLAKALGADAIVIGAVTDYTPYYPPRVGLQVSWYAPEPCRFSPGIPTNPRLNESVKAWRFAAASSAKGDADDDRSWVHSKRVAGVGPLSTWVNADDRRPAPSRTSIDSRLGATRSRRSGFVVEAASTPATPELREADPLSDAFVVRAQSPDVATSDTRILACEATSEIASGPVLLGPNAPQPPTASVRTVAAESAQPPADPVPPPPAAEPPLETATIPPTAAQQPMQPMFPPASCPPVGGEHGAFACPPQWSMDAYGPLAAAANAQGYDPRQPVMSYTRLFDGSDADLTALLRDFVILSGDLRSGGWEAYLHRTEDFIRFTSHRMIVEMLTLHGGESRRRYVWMFRKDRR